MLRSVDFDEQRVGLHVGLVHIRIRHADSIPISSLGKEMLRETVRIDVVKVFLLKCYSRSNLSMYSQEKETMNF